MAKKKKTKKTTKTKKHDSATVVQGQAEAGPPPKMKRKEYEREMRRLHGELVAMQEWVKSIGRQGLHRLRGARHGRQGRHDQADHRAGEPAGVPGRRPAGADRTRAVADVHPALHPALPGRRRGRHLRPQLVQPRRRRAGDGLLHARADRAVPRAGARGREGDGRLRDHPAQVLAGGQPRRADPAHREPHRRPAQGLEAVRHGPEVVQPLVRLLPCPGRDVRGDRHRVGAVVRRAHRRQEAGPAEHHQPPAEPDPVRAASATGRRAAQARRGPAATSSRTLPLRYIPTPF